MSAGKELAKAAPIAPATQTRALAPAQPLTMAARVRDQWAPRAAWTIGRTGPLGLAGIALLLASGVFFVSTYLQVAADVDDLRATLAASAGPELAAGDEPAEAAVVSALPQRTELPAILRQLFVKASQAKLAVDAARYEVVASGAGDVLRYQISFPVAGPYSNIRSFLDVTLSSLPLVSLTGLELERKSVQDGEVEAQIRLTAYTAGTQAAPKLHESPGRVVLPSHAGALFAARSWTIIPPAPAPAPPPPPAPPTAPPLPYAYVGSYAPEGKTPTYFLSHGDRLIDAHVGDHIDGVYQLESAAGGQLVFTYLPLKVRQTLATGASP